MTAAEQPGLAMSSTARLHYMDQVRALAMLAGVFLHAAIAYLPDGEWPIADPARAEVLGLFLVFIHLFRMPLFFLIAGFFANLLVRKRGARAFVNNRAMRIALPFVLFLPVLMLAMVGAIATAGEVLPPELHSEIVSDFLAGREDPDRDGPSTMHLWFLYYLIYLCGGAALLQRWKPAWVGKLTNRLFASGKHLLYVPLLVVPASFAVEAPVPAPGGFAPEPWAFGYHGIFFLIGWHLFHHQDYLKLIDRHVTKLGIFSFVGFALYLGAIATAHDSPTPPSPPFHLATVLLQAYLTFYLILISLSVGKRLLDRESPTMRYVSDASYWIYLVHLPLLMYVQIALVQQPWPALAKFAVCSLLVFAIGLVTYEWLIRYTPVGTMLNGKKVRQPPATLQSAAPDSGS